MKKINFLLLAVIALFAFAGNSYAQCDTIKTFPWTETFEKDSLLSNCWVREGFDTVKTAGLAAINEDHTIGAGGNFITIHWSGLEIGDSVFLTSPVLDLTQLANPSLTFWRNRPQGTYGSGANFQVNVKSNDVWYENLITADLSGYTNGWEDFSVDLSPYKTNDVTISIVAVWSLSTIVFDDITIKEGVEGGCQKPLSLTHSVNSVNKAKVGWEESGSATKWEIMYENDDTKEEISKIVTANTDTLKGLSSGTIYTFQVRSICAEGDTSEWSIVSTEFQTLCDNETYPYIENFDGSWDCLSSINAQGDVFKWVASTSTYFITPLSGQSFAEGGREDDYLITPFLSLDATSTMTWWDIAGLSESIFCTAKYAVLLSESSELDPFNDFTDTLGTYQMGGDNDTTWVQRTIDLSGYAGKKVFITFHTIKEDKALPFGIDNLKVTGTYLDVNTVDVNEASVNVYPNPNNGVFKVAVNSENISDLNIELMNIQGQVIYRNDVKSVSNYTESINVQGFAKGIYFLRVNTGNELKVNKVVIK